MNNLRLALLGLAAIATLILGAGFLERAFRAEQEVKSEIVSRSEPVEAPVDLTGQEAEALRKIEATIATAPDYLRFFERLRLDFPSDYIAILSTLSREAARISAFPSVDAIMTDSVIALRKAHGPLAAKASDEALARIFLLQLDEMRALGKRDVHLCVAFLYGANGSGFLDFAADNRAMIANAGLAGLDAMNGGRIDQIQRAPPDDADFQALDRALTARGLSRPEIEALLDGKTADPPIADERMCVAGQTYLETLSRLDARTRARLYGLAVDLMAKT